MTNLRISLAMMKGEPIMVNEADGKRRNRRPSVGGPVAAFV